MKSDADISQLFACHQFALDMFQRDIFGFRNEPESDAHKRNVQRSVEPERTGSANAIKQCQEGRADNHINILPVGGINLTQNGH